jgi:hypothetical protein
MRKNANCRTVGYETFCINGCCESAALIACGSRTRKNAGKVHKKR